MARDSRYGSVIDAIKQETLRRLQDAVHTDECDLQECRLKHHGTKAVKMLAIEFQLHPGCDIVRYHASESFQLTDDL
jgi:hypothetical protein